MQFCFLLAETEDHSNARRGTVMHQPGAASKFTGWSVALVMFASVCTAGSYYY